MVRKATTGADEPSFLGPNGSGVSSLRLGDDQGLALAVDPSGQVVITGRTLSPAASFPLKLAFDPFLTPADKADAFVATFDVTQTMPANALVFSSYLGGSEDDAGYGVTTDSNGDIFVTGYAQSTDFVQVNPILLFSGQWDAFVTKIQSNSVVFSTYLGGSLGDSARGIRVDSGGMYIVGDTQSSPGSGPTTDDFYANLDAVDPLTPLLSFDATFNGGSSACSGFWGCPTLPTDLPTEKQFMSLADAFITKLELP